MVVSLPQDDGGRAMPAPTGKHGRGRKDGRRVSDPPLRIRRNNKPHPFGWGSLLFGGTFVDLVDLLGTLLVAGAQGLHDGFYLVGFGFAAVQVGPVSLHEIVV